MTYDYESFYKYAQEYIDGIPAEEPLSRDDAIFFNLCLLFLDEMDEDLPDMPTIDLILETIALWAGTDVFTYSLN